MHMMLLVKASSIMDQSGGMMVPIENGKIDTEIETAKKIKPGQKNVVGRREARDSK